ncbi:MAG TPA: response regulator [Herpetosiphonaceae bacterium]
MIDAAHILIVDDQKDNTVLLQYMLKAAGYRVSDASDGPEGLAFIKTCLPDLVLLDVMLPGMSGYEVLRTLRADAGLPFIPVMLVTAKQGVQDTVQGMDAGADDFLRKPVQRDELLARVRALLRLKQARDELVREQERTELLYRIAQALHASLDIDHVIAETLRLVGDNLRATQGSVLLLDKDNRIWRQILLRPNLPAEAAEAAVQSVLQDGLAAYALAVGTVQIAADTMTDPRWKQLYDDRHEIRSALALPLIDHQANRPVGVLTLVHPQRHHFTPAIEPLAAAIGEQISSALTNASLYTKLREAEESREYFIQMLTHDLRAPLAGMIGCFDALNTTSLDDHGRLFVDLGFRAGAAQMRLIDNLLDIYKAEAGHLQLAEDLVSLAQLGEQVNEQLLGAAHDMGVSLAIALPAEPLAVLDGNKMTRVLTNLANNGLKWTRRGGSVRLSGEIDAEARRITIRVADTGNGIPPEDIPRIFDKFFQGSSRASVRGVGLGLTFCALVVEAHDGSIAVESAVGEGTTMIITLPWKEE